MPDIPGEGLTAWNYTAIANHFYQKYHDDHAREQEEVFDQVVAKILEIVETEYQTGNLERLNVWPWCTLSSGQPWPLSKWIKVNSLAPYKRAARIIKKYSRNHRLLELT